MRLILLLVAAMAYGTPATAQDPPASSTKAEKAPLSQDTSTQMPVSLDRIREGLKKPQDQTLLHAFEIRADFTVQIQEQAHIDELMSKLSFKSGPVPAGGLYGYEQQRRLFNPTDRPLQQPYAAFSGGEFITIAIENLIRAYLGDKLKDNLATRSRTRNDAQARKEVDQAVEEYCAERPDRYEIQLCNGPALR